MFPPKRLPYNGQYCKLVLAFDIGTTFSGISYSILDPGLVPEVKPVTRFPCQENVGGDSKIPTIIWYDVAGKVRAVGAAAAKESLEDMGEDEGWSKAEWFKLHLRPRANSNESGDSEKIPPLPPNKTAINVFADFMHYLHECACSFIEQSRPDGRELWISVKPHTDFVLTHPNGWEGAQQAQMRTAAIQGGLIPDTAAGRARIHFVTEGESSLHFCIQGGLTTQSLQKGEGILVVDAGGGTIDLSAYGGDAVADEWSLHEIAPPQCLFQGSIFVTKRARTFIERIFCGSKYEGDVDQVTKRFDKSAKLCHRDLAEPQYIQFGRRNDNDPDLRIRAGKLKLSGSEVASFFEPSVQAILQAIREQIKAASTTITSVFLVGGFGASDWLFSRLQKDLEPLGISFCRPDSRVNKAVADGGVSYYIDRFVTARVSKYAYGINCSVHYDGNDSEHVKRSSTVTVDARGSTLIPSGFGIILPKDTRVLETKEFRRSWMYTYQRLQDVPAQIELSIICFKGFSKQPRWIDEEADKYATLCRIVVDGAQVKHSMVTKPTVDGTRIYYHLDIETVLTFGLVELTAQICWNENGQEKRSRAELVYVDSG